MKAVKLLAVVLGVALVGHLSSSAEPAAVKLTPPLGLPELTFPRQYTVTQERIDLGKKLFYDRRYSFSGKTACASCHHPEHGFADLLPLGFTSFGATLQRNTPTVLNAAYNDFEFWDGRADSLEGQAQEVYHSTSDNDVNLENVIVDVAADPEYSALFQKAFGAPPTAENFKRAITCYELTLLSGNSPFDQFAFAGNTTALTPQEKHGLEVFQGKGNCTSCHLIEKDHALFMDQKFHNLGISYQPDGKLLDGGRYGVTAKRADIGAFKTPGLRNVSLTAPYMHDGSLPTLEAVVDFYDRGGNPNPNLDPLMKPLHLTADEKSALVAFLKTLTEEKWARIALPDADMMEVIKKDIPPTPPY